MPNFNYIEILENFEKKYKKFFEFSFWKEEVKNLKRRGKRFWISVIVVLLLFVFSGYFYFFKMKVVPVNGGEFIEGSIVEPRFINPLYVDNDTDRDLVELLYSGLFSYNEKGEIVNDLVESYEIKDGGKTYEFHLKDNAFWHDGEKVTADDVVFTIEMIQNPGYKTPLIVPWFDVKVEKISDRDFLLKIKNPYAGFLENCTLKILPKHIWEKVSVEKLPLVLSDFPKELLIGSGPFKIKELNFKEGTSKLDSIVLERHEKYHQKPPYLSQITFKFFENYKELLKAFNRKEIDGFAILAPFEKKNLHNRYSLSFLKIPRYFALFFNLKNPLFQDKKTRMALNYAVDKNKILEKVLKNEGEIIESPLLDKFFNLKEPSLKYNFDLEKAKKLLEESGYKLNENQKLERVVREESSFVFKNPLKPGNKGEEVKKLQTCLSMLPFETYPEKEISGFYGNSTKEAVKRFQETLSIKPADGVVGKKTIEALNQTCHFPKETLILEFSISTLDDPLLETTANLIKEDLKNLGVEVEIKTYSMSELIRKIQEKDYESILFGESLTFVPDPFAFWGSIGNQGNGLNLSSFENKEIDQLLNEARSTLDENARKEKLEKIQDILLEEAPAIFLYNPNYYYFVLKEVRGVPTEIKIVDPSKRFVNVKDWYKKTKRVLR